MKKVVLAALASLPLLASSQSFKLLTTDGTGDAHGFSTDATELAYTFSANNDSLYVKISHNNARPDDFGFALAIDTNLNPSDGNAINQTNIFAQPNTSMKADILLYGYQNGTFPTVYTEAYGPSGSPIVINFELDTADAFHSIFRILLADLGGNMDFNLIGFTGGFDISVSGPSDAIPNSTYAEIRGSHVSIAEHKTSLGIYPNPAQNFFRMKEGGQLYIYNTTGALVKKVTANANQPIDCSDLARGLYHIILNDGNSAGKLIVE